MAKGLTEFSIQQAYNYTSFSDWNYEELSFYATGEGVPDTSTYITEANPAKKVVLYQLPSNDGVLLEETNRITIKLNDAADSHIIEIDGGELPYTISGIIVTDLRIVVSSAASGDKISVLSFH